MADTVHPRKPHHKWNAPIAPKEQWKLEGGGRRRDGSWKAGAGGGAALPDD